MKLKDVLTPSFRDLGRELDLKVEVFDGRLVIIAPMWRKALSVESQFCRAVVASGYLTNEQMRRAARRYRLGATKNGGVIFWQMDAEGVIYDGKVMYYREDCHRDKLHHPTWVSTLLTHRHHWPDADRLTTRHCFFGTHLLERRRTTEQRGRKSNLFSGRKNSLFCESGERGIAVVESEKSAVILSELFPHYLWLATGGMGNVQPDSFRPLRGHRVVLFPDTDPDGTAYRRWYEAAQTVMQQPFWEGSPPITVSPLLELHATPKQKAAKIDIVDFIFDQR